MWFSHLLQLNRVKFARSTTRRVEHRYHCESITDLERESYKIRCVLKCIHIARWLGTDSIKSVAAVQAPRDVSKQTLT